MTVENDRRLLAAVLESMEVGLAALDAEGVVTHWNREAGRLLGWSEAEAVGRRGLEGWALRPADAEALRTRLREAGEPGRAAPEEFPLLTSDGRRLLVRAQLSAVRTAEGTALGHYLAFSEAGAQIELERTLGLAHSLLDEAPTGLVLVDADLRPATVGEGALRLLDCERGALLGLPLAELLAEGAQELESALQHSLSTGKALAGVKLWVGLAADPLRRRCLRSEFVPIGSPLGDLADPVPLGVAWLFEDVTLQEQAEQEAALLRFRAGQLRRAGQAAAECADPLEAAAGYLDFVLAGFADHALLDLLHGGALIRTAVAPLGPLGPHGAVGRLTPTGLPARYGEVHPALRALERSGTVCTSDTAGPRRDLVRPDLPNWAALRRWPPGTVHGLATPLRSRGRNRGVLTFLRGPGRQRFDRADVEFAEDVAARVAAAVDLAMATGARGGQKV